MIKVIIETVPHETQRYNTVGDWIYTPLPDNTLIVRVSDLNNWRYEMLIAIHELVEAALCSHANINQDMVDAFDFNYKGDLEPGDDPKAPYVGPHCIATGVERIIAASMGITWSKYESTLDDKSKS